MFVAAVLTSTGCGAASIRSRSVDPGQVESAPGNARQPADVEEKPPATYEEPDELDEAQPPQEEFAKQEAPSGKPGTF